MPRKSSASMKWEAKTFRQTERGTRFAWQRFQSGVPNELYIDLQAKKCTEFTSACFNAGLQQQKYNLSTREQVAWMQRVWQIGSNHSSVHLQQSVQRPAHRKTPYQSFVYKNAISSVQAPVKVSKLLLECDNNKLKKRQ